MTFQSQQLVARDSIPNLTGAIITARDEFIARFVERTIGQRQNVSAQNLEQEEVAGFSGLQLLNQLLN